MWSKLFSNPTKLSAADRKTTKELTAVVYAVYAQLEGLTKADALRVLNYVLSSNRREW